MVYRTRQVLAVMVVATALCADQIATAAPSARTRVAEAGRIDAMNVGDLAGRLVRRLSRSLRESVPSAIARPVRRRENAASVVTVARRDQSLGVVRQLVSPFQFRLPPPQA